MWYDSSCWLSVWSSEVEQSTYLHELVICPLPKETLGHGHVGCQMMAESCFHLQWLLTLEIPKNHLQLPSETDWTDGTPGLVQSLHMQDLEALPDDHITITLNAQVPHAGSDHHNFFQPLTGMDWNHDACWRRPFRQQTYQKSQAAYPWTTSSTAVALGFVTFSVIHWYGLG